ncbi:MAG: AMP-dependent synthetase and ligase [Alphaproteobacteria bacterium]|nr:AMP-dependent synthetase and ligase [Alphaproteobacteria bacterium]
MAKRRSLDRSIVNPFAGRDVNWLLDWRAETRRDHPFLVWEPFTAERQVWTYGQFRQKVLRVAAGLHKRGIKPGDFVLVHLDNCPELEFLWFACARIGAIVVTTNTRSAGPELEYFADHCGAVAAVTQPELAGLVAQHAKNIKWLAVTENTVDGAPADGSLKPEKALSFSQLDGDPADLPKLDADPWRAGSVQYTSGTTSRPKGVLWTQGNALWGARTSAVHQGLRADEVHLTMMPAFHTNARTYSILPTMWVGGTVVLQPRFSASRFWDVAMRNKATWMSTLPFFAKAVMDQEVPKHHFRTWGFAIVTDAIKNHFGVDIVSWWGMTETVSQGLITDLVSPNQDMTTGRPAPEYGVKIVRDDGVTPVEPGEIGHLRFLGVPGVSIFAEYLNNPQATADSFDEQGWFLTGDRVRLEHEGSITFSDRDKDMLKVGGENVAASEIEAVIALVPGVYECAVVAQKHRMLDEVPVAFVRPADGVKIKGNNELPAAVLDACRKNLANFKVPRQVLLVEDFPRSTLEKISKNELRKTLPVAD